MTPRDTPAAIELPALSYPFATPPDPGTVREVARGIYWLCMPLPFALDHINLWLIEDGDGWAIIDCGFGTDQTRALWTQILDRRLGGGPVTRILVTHFHPDHFGLAAWLSDRQAASVWMAQPELDAARAWFEERPWFKREAFLRMFREHGLDYGADAGEFARGNLYKLGVPSIPAQCRPLRDGDEIAIDGRAWRVITGHGHSPEHAALACDALNVMIAGDMILPRISTNVSVQAHQPDGNPLKEFLDSLARYATCPSDMLVLPSHGLPFRGLHARIAALAQHHAQRLDELRQACLTPRTAAELMPLLFRRELDRHQIFFAMGETLAHLNYLMHAGALRRVANGAVFRFVIHSR